MFTPKCQGKKKKNILCLEQIRPLYRNFIINNICESLHECSSCMFYPDTDELNRVQVKEGVFVTLGSGLTKLEGDDLVQWRFEHEDHVIAKINKTASSSSTFDGANGRFRGRLELDDETGSLTIRKIAAAHSGLYHLDITGSRHTIFKKFIVFVCGEYIKCLNEIICVYNSTVLHILQCIFKGPK